SVMFITDVREATYAPGQPGRALLWDRRTGGGGRGDAPYRALLRPARAPAHPPWDRTRTTLHCGAPGTPHPHPQAARSRCAAGRDRDTTRWRTTSARGLSGSPL